MVTSSHEASHQIFQDRPELLTPAFRILGVPLPAKASIEVLCADATEMRPLERRVDSVLRVVPSDGGDFLLAIEAQGRRDPDKAASWTYYLAYLSAKYRTPALLLVICQDRATASWAAGPFSTGVEGWTALCTHPLVLGPDNVPVITDPAIAARDLALATFCAMTHGRDRNINAILEALASALGSADRQSSDYYAELLEIGLGDTPARATWKELMKVNGSYFPGRGTIVEETYLEGKAKGKAEGEANSRVTLILRLLEGRGIAVSDEARTRITGCTELDVLDRWFDRALTAQEADELFADDIEADTEAAR